MEYYIARDKDGALCLYEELPLRGKELWNGFNFVNIDSNLFPEVTWESEPVKVNLKLEKI